MHVTLWRWFQLLSSNLFKTENVLIPSFLVSSLTCDDQLCWRRMVSQDLAESLWRLLNVVPLCLSHTKNWISLTWPDTNNTTWALFSFDHSGILLEVKHLSIFYDTQYFGYCLPFNFPAYLLHQFWLYSVSNSWPLQQSCNSLLP